MVAGLSLSGDEPLRFASVDVALSGALGSSGFRSARAY
jgi:hypothetical protein